MRPVSLSRRLARQEHAPVTRELRTLVLRHALAAGRSLSVDALDVTLAVAQHRHGPCHWTEDKVLAFALVDVAQWCAAHDILPPPGVLDALAVVLEALHRERMLDPGSAGITALREALRSVGAGHSQRSHHPSQAQRAPVVQLPEPSPAG